MAKIIVTGVRELDAMLKAMEPAIARKIVRGALRKGGKRVLEKARAKAPEDTGALRKGMRVRAMKRQKYRAGVTVEHPTREKLAALQKDQAKGARVLSEKGYYPAAVEYGAPGRPAQPHLRPALEESTPAVIADFRQDVRDGIAEATRK
jgi:HK97 gp10 family phage protein